MKKGILAATCVLALVTAAHAGTVAFWDFDNQTQLGTSSLWQINPLGTTAAPTDYAPDLGFGTADLSVWGGSDSTVGNLVGTNGTSLTTITDQFGSYTGNILNDIRPTPLASGSLSIVGMANNGKSFLLELNSAFTSGNLSYATRGTATGYNTQTIDASTDGGLTWTNLATITGRNVTTWSVQTVSLGDIFGTVAGHDMNLIRFTVTGDTSTSGNNRFDNILITGVPEPASLMLLGLGGVAILRRRR